MCSAKITPMILMNTVRMPNTCPVQVMSRNMPKMYIGSSGRMTADMVRNTMPSKSLAAPLSVVLSL